MPTILRQHGSYLNKLNVHSDTLHVKEDPHMPSVFLEPWAPKSAVRMGILCLLNSAKKTWEKFSGKDRSFSKRLVVIKGRERQEEKGRFFFSRQ